MNITSGVASFLMNIYRHIDHDKIQFDFLSYSLSENNYVEEIKLFGGNVHNAPNYKKHFFKYINYIQNIITNGNYDIVHCHEFLLSICSLFIAKSVGVKVRIIHSHNSSISSLWKKLTVYLFRIIWKYFATDFFACSTEAAHFLFGERCKYVIVNNAIEPERYVFNVIVRNNIRNNLHLPENAFVIGYIARFVKEKNHLFLINAFINILQKNINAYLLLAGEGILQDTVKKYADKLNLSKNMIFYGVSNKVYELYSVMDVFVFPSLFEGLGITGIEAQCAGLPVIASNNIPKTMQVTNLVQWLDLKDGPEKWAEKILEYLPLKDRMNMCEVITQNSYNIKNESKKLELMYNKLKISA
jgi:glycosyltransferase involved in cell wall biosynthesis